MHKRSSNILYETVNEGLWGTGSQGPQTCNSVNFSLSLSLSRSLSLPLYIKSHWSLTKERLQIRSTKTPLWGASERINEHWYTFAHSVLLPWPQLHCRETTQGEKDAARSEKKLKQCKNRDEDERSVFPLYPPPIHLVHRLSLLRTFTRSPLNIHEHGRLTPSSMRRLGAQMANTCGWFKGRDCVSTGSQMATTSSGTTQTHTNTQKMSDWYNMLPWFSPTNILQCSSDFPAQQPKWSITADPWWSMKTHHLKKQNKVDLKYNRQERQWRQQQQQQVDLDLTHTCTELTAGILMDLICLIAFLRLLQQTALSLSLSL